MAYETQGISALDPRVAATEKFINENNIPPEQVPDFLMQMGADPKLAGLVFKYRRLQNAAGQQQNQPPASTVAQDVDQQYAQMQQGVASLPAPVMENAQFQGGIAPPQEEAPPQGMAGGGIVAFSNGGVPSGSTIFVDPAGRAQVGAGSIPPGQSIVPYESPIPDKKDPWWKRGPKVRMPPGMARFMPRMPKGRLGLAALVGGVGYMALSPEEQEAVQQAQVDPEGLTDAQRALLAELDKKQPPQTAGDMEMPARPEFIGANTSILDKAIAEYEKGMPKSRDEAIAQQRAMEEEIGETKAIAARREKLEKQLEKSEMPTEKRFWLAFAQAGFAASAKGARNLWETLSKGGEEGLKAYQSMKDKEEATRERLEDKLLQLDSMESAIKRGVITRGDAEYKETRKQVLDLRVTQQAQRTALAEAQNRFNIGTYSAEMQAAIAKMSRTQRQEAAANLEKQYTADILAAQKTTDPETRKALELRAQETLRALQAFAEADPSVVRAVTVDRLQRELIQGGPGGGAGDGFGGMTAE